MSQPDEPDTRGANVQQRHTLDSRCWCGQCGDEPDTRGVAKRKWRVSTRPRFASNHCTNCGLNPSKDCTCQQDWDREHPADTRGVAHAAITKAFFDSELWFTWCGEELHIAKDGLLARDVAAAIALDAIGFDAEVAKSQELERERDEARQWIADVVAHPAHIEAHRLREALERMRNNHTCASHRHLPCVGCEAAAALGREGEG